MSGARAGFAAAAFAALCCLPDAASAQTPASQPGAIGDPWQPLNRRLFSVHELLDKTALEPAARAYRAATPRFFRSGVRNALANARGPMVLANDLLQGEFSRAGATASRFGLNSTFGVLGLVDVASEMGIQKHDEDFGQTLAVWGVPAGPYLFVPLRGPTTVRDALGWVGDAGLDPLNYAKGDAAQTARVANVALTALSAREGLIDAIDGVRNTSPDPYLTIRVTYELTRDDAIANRTGDADDAPPDFGPAE
jgi:phospholipid-binding lipoprotein MlaA